MGVSEAADGVGVGTAGGRRRGLAARRPAAHHPRPNRLPGPPAHLAAALLLALACAGGGGGAEPVPPAAAAAAPSPPPASPATPAAPAAPVDTVVVMVFDGVAAETLTLAPTPTFERMRREGAWSHHLEPAFPTLSLINGFTLSTGCWPEHHGIVSNQFLDPERGFYDHSRDADWLTGCEGLHEAAERQGVPTATLGWYGQRSSTRGDLASTTSGETSFDEFPDDATRAEQVAEQLARTDAARPRLVLAYFRGPDDAEHMEGMGSKRAREAVAAMDAAVARVLEAAQAQGPPGRVAVLVTTDHGMREVSRLVNVRRILHWHGIRARPVMTGTTAFLYLEPGEDADAAARTLSRYEQLDVLRKGALPAYARLGDGPRVPDLVLSAHPPYFIEDAALWPASLRWLARWGPRFVWARPFVKATHGYPVEMEPKMEGVLYAWGAGIAPGREVAHVRSVDLHPTVTALLGIAPGQPVDGRVARGFLVGKAGAGE